jgi:hypothetical protein
MDVMPSCGPQKTRERVVIGTTVDEGGIRADGCTKEGEEESQSVRHKELPRCVDVSHRKRDDSQWDRLSVRCGFPADMLAKLSRPTGFKQLLDTHGLQEIGRT